MLRFLLNTLLLSLLFSTTHAQILYTLSGTVRDSATSQPLNRAAVVLNYEKAATGTYIEVNGASLVATKPAKIIN